ncbi:MAG: hypothetical protein ABIJ97_10090 [Bacteroidota bacterium]
MLQHDSLEVIAHLRDGGPVYAETDFDRFIVEPWSTITAFLFVGISTYWFLRLRNSYSQHKFLVYVLILLSIGGIGGIIYHAFRISRVFILMDWMPIMIIAFSMTIYFFIRATGKWWPALVLFGVVFGLNGLNFKFIPHNMSISISYSMMGIAAIVPIVLMLRKSKLYKAKFFFIAIVFLVLAVLSRILDKYVSFPMGTHFLWHVFGAIGTFLIINYVYHIDEYDKSLKR